MIAAFAGADTTDFAPNPFPQTSAGVVRYVWTQRGGEFRRSRHGSRVAEPFSCVVGDGRGRVSHPGDSYEEGRNTTNRVPYIGDGVSIIGVVLYGKPGVALPTPRARDRYDLRLLAGSRTLREARQLDLFAMGGP